MEPRERRHLQAPRLCLTSRQMNLATSPAVGGTVGRKVTPITAAKISTSQKANWRRDAEVSLIGVCLGKG